MVARYFRRNYSIKFSYKQNVNFVSYGFRWIFRKRLLVPVLEVQSQFYLYASTTSCLYYYDRYQEKFVQISFKLVIFWPEVLFVLRLRIVSLYDTKNVYSSCKHIYLLQKHTEIQSTQTSSLSPWKHMKHVQPKIFTNRTYLSS